jgi:UDP-N-acetylmuramate dehydrogenase
MFRLTKAKHQLHIDYGSIQSELASRKISSPTIKDVADVVISIRQSKLPNPIEIGNSGSFFKNPIVNDATFQTLKTKYPNMPHYLINEDRIKIPAGWLIEQAGLKGYRQGDAGVHNKQALVLVNYGKASGRDIYQLSKYVEQQVFDKFGIQLENEVNIF